MSDRFKFIVVGRGMMGAAAARHLTLESKGVAVIGPDEPADPARHEGVFASHYDEARITRTIDPDPVWAALANRSIARYRELERESGVDFYHEVGCLIVGPKRGGSDPYVQRICEAADRTGVAPQMLECTALAERFPYFSFGAGQEGVHEAAGAGYLNPRQMVRGQSCLAHRQGATLIAETVVSVRDDIRGVAVRTAEGNTYYADRVLVAAGGFSIAEHLLPRPVDLKVYARTVAFFEIPEADLEAFAGMPSLIHHPDDPLDHIYLLPPVRYPDGKVYLKIGGDPDDLELASEPEVRAWYRSGGRETTRRHLTRIAAELVPGVVKANVTMGACVTSFTPSGYPAIGYVDEERIAVVTGGCGAAAKSSDEIGRLGARLLLDGALSPEDQAVFAPRFR
ncbi:FAD-dependent oxidoreductase [Ciceribacter ferrooxidans]|uniref:FAD-dependent oxidoreductase n=1 Tax=Ciceribacter ferrooxidans TaxID=2509717 RepID=A0A4Q2T5A4_9HYPH|nr:FAD-dependent oxidoreductase [Ciceribacter ferrooxidans]RYC12078.1 FAD-dependent oxidoreductase [Ciceribacter ferrooxidans]